MIKTLLSFLFILIIYTCNVAQTITVKDKITLQPIGDIIINKIGKTLGYITSTSIGKTDAKGIFTFATPFNPIEIFDFNNDGYFTENYTGEQLQKMNFLVLLTEKATFQQKAVVSASRFEEKAEDVAKQVSVINKKEMQFNNQSTTADLLQQTGKVFIQKSQMGGGSIAMRGFEANKVLMVVDGVRLNNAIYRGGHLQNAISVDNNMLEKTEILFGAGSVMYGSDALGGVVSFYTKNPLFSKTEKPLVKTMAFMRYGTAMNEQTGHFDINIGFKKLAFLSSVTYSDFGDMRIGKKGIKGYESWGRRTFYVDRINNKDSMVLNSDSFKQTPTGYKQYDLMQKIAFKQNKYITHLLNLQYSNTTNIPRYDRLTEKAANGKPSNAEWYYGPQTRGFTSYKLAIEKNHIAFNKANIILAYQKIKESRHNRNFNAANRSNRMEEVDIITLNADFEKNFSENTELRYGAEITHNNVQSTANKVNISTNEKTPQSTRYPDGGSIMRSTALYATQSTYLSKQWILNTGIRFTNTYLKSVFMDKTFFPFLANNITQNNQNTSGNLGLVYLINKNLKLYSCLATGFRSPNVDDMAKVFESNGNNQQVIIPNANVKPEQTTTLDLGINTTIRKKLSVELNGYYTKFSNALTLNRSQLNGKDTITFNGVLSKIFSMQNAQSAYIYGYFAGANYELSKKWNVYGNINYTYGRINTDTVDYPLDHISPVFGTMGCMYKTKQLKVEFFTQFNGAKKAKDYNLLGEDNEEYSAEPTKGFNPAWYTLNIRGSYQINKLLQVQLALENILNQHYRTFSSGYSAAGRNVMATIRGTF